MELEESTSDVLVVHADLKRFGIKLSSDALRQQERRGEFPARRRIGARRIAWLRSEVEHWLANLPLADVKRAPATLPHSHRAPRAPGAPKIGRPTKAEAAARDAARLASIAVGKK